MLTHEEATRLMVVVRGKMTGDERKALSEYLQVTGLRERVKAGAISDDAAAIALNRISMPCHCYEACEDDDEGVERRLHCRLRDWEPSQREPQ